MELIEEAEELILQLEPDRWPSDIKTIRALVDRLKAKQATIDKLDLMLEEKNELISKQIGELVVRFNKINELTEYLESCIGGFENNEPLSSIELNEIRDLINSVTEKKCEHGKGLTDYCLECGRVHSE